MTRRRVRSSPNSYRVMYACRPVAKIDRTYLTSFRCRLVNTLPPHRTTIPLQHYTYTTTTITKMDHVRHEYIIIVSVTFEGIRYVRVWDVFEKNGSELHESLRDTERNLYCWSYFRRFLKLFLALRTAHHEYIPGQWSYTLLMS